MIQAFAIGMLAVLFCLGVMYYVGVKRAHGG